MPWLFEKRYRLEDEPLGAGGVGAVYAGINIHSQKAVAIKLIEREKAERMQVRRFEREAVALAALDHPNIVKLLECGETDQHLYLVMERARGDTLRKLISRATRAGKRIDLPMAVFIMAQVARAMTAAHKLGIVHRDIKPDNIMVGERGAVLVLDFGLALRLDANQRRVTSSGATHPDLVPGTPRYMPVEQILGGNVDGRTDVYAMGITLYETLSGRTPYDHYEDARSTATELWAHHIHGTPTDLRDLIECPAKVWEIARRSIQKRPEARYQTAGELAAALRDVMREHPLVPHRVTRESIDVRPTEPEVMSLPQDGPEPELYQARETAPMAPNFTPSAPLPFTPALATPGRGVGFTARMAPLVTPPRPTFDEPWADAEEPTRDPVLPAPLAATPSALSTDVRRSAPTIFTPRRHRRKRPPYYVAPVLGVVLGGIAAVALRRVQGPESTVASAARLPEPPAPAAPVASESAAVVLPAVASAASSVVRAVSSAPPPVAAPSASSRKLPLKPQRPPLPF
jgi:serine/threonine protein kinase